MGWWWVVNCFFFLKRRGGGRRRSGREESEKNVSPRWESSRLRPPTLQQDPGVAIAGETLPRADHVCERRGVQASARGWRGARRRGPGGGGEGGEAGRGRGEGGGASAELPGGKAFAALLPRCTAARPPRPVSDPPSVAAAAGDAAHNPRKGSEGPPEKNPKRSIPLGCKLLFSVLGAFPPPSLAFFP